MLKKVVVETQKGFKVFGKCVRNGEENTFNIRQIFALLGYGHGIKVFEVLPNGERIRLNRDNYDKNNVSSVPSVEKTEVDHKEPENINESNPTQSDVSSNEDKVETTGPVEEPVSEIVEEPEIIEEEKELVIDATETEVSNDEEEEPVESAVEEEKIENEQTNTTVAPTEEPGTEDEEESLVEETEVTEEEVTNDAAAEEVVDVAEEEEKEEVVNTVPYNKSSNNNGYNIPKKGNKYYKK